MDGLATRGIAASRCLRSSSSTLVRGRDMAASELMAGEGERRKKEREGQ